MTTAKLNYVEKPDGGTMSGETLTLIPTHGLRWKKKNKSTILQQRFTTSTGKEVWREVPTVE